MSEICDGMGRFDRLKSSAYWVNSHLSSNVVLDKELMVDDYKNFLNEKIKNPTAGAIAMHKAKKGISNADSTEYIGKKKMLERIPEIDTMVKHIDKKEKENYPKTGKIRKVLIQNDNFDLNGTMPKLSKPKKLLLKLKSLL